MHNNVMNGCWCDLRRDTVNTIKIRLWQENGRGQQELESNPFKSFPLMFSNLFTETYVSFFFAPFSTTNGCRESIWWVHYKGWTSLIEITTIHIGWERGWKKWNLMLLQLKFYKWFVLSKVSSAFQKSTSSFL